MKKIGILVLLSSVLLRGFGQEVKAIGKDTLQMIQPADTNESARVIIGDKAVSVENEKNAVKVQIGDRRVSILENLEQNKPEIKFEKIDREEENKDSERDEDKSDKDKSRPARHFHGHWSGAEFGFNNYVVSGYNMSLPPAIDYMSLHSGKSNNFNINFAQLSLGLTRHFGIVTGLGFNWNNYRFDGNNNIQKGTDGVIEMLDPGDVLKKSKLSTWYLTLPVLVEIQIPAEHNRISLSAGPIGALKLLSHSKMIYENGDKVKSDGDFSLNMLRYGATARIGYGNFQIYGTYYKTPLFKTGKTPGGVDLYPFEIGIACTFND